MGVKGYWVGTSIFAALEVIFLLWIRCTGRKGENGFALPLLSACLVWALSPFSALLASNISRMQASLPVIHNRGRLCMDDVRGEGAKVSLGL